MLWERLAAIKKCRVETSLRMVLIMLAEHMADDRLVCWVGSDTLADETGLSERQVRDVLKDLESRGLIRRWSGDHRCQDTAIEWGALATAKAVPHARGGKRTPAKTAALPAKTAGDDTGKDCRSDRQRLPVAPAKTAAVTGKDCPRTDPLTIQRTDPENLPSGARELPPATIPEVLPERPRRPPPREPEIPTEAADWVALLQHEPDGADVAVRLFRAGVTTLGELRALSLDRLQFKRGIGPDRAAQVQRALRLRGLDLAPPQPRAGAPPGRRKPGGVDILESMERVHNESESR